ncbi:hypothetical protein PULV_a2473 [Pseudoalteromonas ulvae UL12]|nr:hypothetical protein [Pseudoalteromonas ulvae UL12]
MFVRLAALLTLSFQYQCQNNFLLFFMLLCFLADIECLD